MRFGNYINDLIEGFDKFKSKEENLQKAYKNI